MSPPGRFRVRPFILALAVLALATVLLDKLNSRPPSINSLLRHLTTVQMSPGEQMKIEAQIVDQGEAAIPKLIAAINRRDSKLTDWYGKILGHLPKRIAGVLPPSPVPAHYIHQAAMMLLPKFHQRAQLAIPTVARIALDRSGNSDERELAMGVLFSIKPRTPQSSSTIRFLFQDPDENFRIMAASWLKNESLNDPELRPVALSLIMSTNATAIGAGLDLYPSESDSEAALLPVLQQILKSGDVAHALEVVQVHRFQRLMVKTKEVLIPSLVTRLTAR